MLCYYTPLYVNFDGVFERGWGNVLVIGDTTVGKSASLRALIRLLGQGCYATAETATLVGLIGTVVQVEGHGWLPEAGLLTLMDGKLLCVDGYQKLPREQSAALAEAEREGCVRLTKAARDVMPARTRQIKIANPLDPSASGYKTASLREFRYPVQAVATVLDKTGIARLDLVVFAAAEDVPHEEINVKWLEKPEEELFYLAESLKLVWSGVPIEFEQEAVEAILEQANQLIEEFYVPDIPLLSADTKFKLARLSAALAALTLSLDDRLSKIIVTREHVEWLANFIREEYSRAGLNALASFMKDEELTEEKAVEIARYVMEQAQIPYKKAREILLYIVSKGRVTADEIRAKFELAEKNQARPLFAALKAQELVKIGKGYYPTARLIQLSKILEALPDLPEMPGFEGYPPSSLQPITSQADENELSPQEGGYVVEAGNSGKSGKDTELRLICSRCLEDVRKTSIFVEVVDKRTGLGACEFCGEKEADFIIRVRGV